MRSGCGSTLTTTCGTTPARRHAPSAPSAATMVPGKVEARRRSRLRRRWRLGPAPTMSAVLPAPSWVSRRSRTERAIRGRLRSALASPTAATRSNVAASRALAIFFPSSIRPLSTSASIVPRFRCPVFRIRSARLRLRLALPHETLLAHEADAAAEAREGLLLELVGRVRGVPLVLDLRLHLVVALEELRHAQLLFTIRPPALSPLPAGEARRLRVRNFSGGRPRRTRPATCRSGLSKVAMTIPSTSAAGSSETGRTGRPRKWPPPSP